MTEKSVGSNYFYLKSNSYLRKSLCIRWGESWKSMWKSACFPTGYFLYIFINCFFRRFSANFQI